MASMAQACPSSPVHAAIIARTERAISTEKSAPNFLKYWCWPSLLAPAIN
jgi:hypothetical protein